MELDAVDRQRRVAQQGHDGAHVQEFLGAAARGHPRLGEHLLQADAVFDVVGAGTLAVLLTGAGTATSGGYPRQGAVILGAVDRAVPAEQRSMAMGISSAAGSFGQFLMVPVENWLIGGFGWLIFTLFGGWISDKVGGAKITLYVFGGMAVAVGLIMASLELKSFPLYLASFLLLFVLTGIGNGLADETGAMSSDVAERAVQRRERRRIVAGLIRQTNHHIEATVPLEDLPRLGTTDGGGDHGLDIIDIEAELGELEPVGAAGHIGPLLVLGPVVVGHRHVVGVNAGILGG